MTILLWLMLVQPLPATCTVTNLNPVQVACAVQQADPVTFTIEDTEWPAAWGSGPHLTGVYNAMVEAGQLVPVATLTDPRRNEAIRAQTLREQQRWRILPAQYSPRP